MYTYFNRIGIECRQSFFRHIILMIDQNELTAFSIQPFRLLTARNEINLADPRRKLLNTPEPIAHKIPVTISVLT